MNWLRELARRLSMLLHSRRFDAELEEEMRLHVELREQEHLASGMNADDARAAARRRFGNATYLKEEPHRLGLGVVRARNTGCQLRYAGDAVQSRHYVGRVAFARPRYRRKHRDLQPDGCGHAQITARQAARPAGFVW